MPYEVLFAAFLLRFRKFQSQVQNFLLYRVLGPRSAKNLGYYISIQRYINIELNTAIFGARMILKQSTIQSFFAQVNLHILKCINEFRKSKISLNQRSTLTSMKLYLECIQNVSIKFCLRMTRIMVTAMKMSSSMAARI